MWTHGGQIGSEVSVGSHLPTCLSGLGFRLTLTYLLPSRTTEKTRDCPREGDFRSGTDVSGEVWSREDRGPSTPVYRRP